MKLFFSRTLQRTRTRALIALFILSLSASSRVHSQTNDQSPSRDRNDNSPTRTSPTPTPAANQSSPTAPPQTRATREERAQAYAKLLEGQRYLTIIRRTRDFDSPLLGEARAAFAEAARLDPSLAEAHTALAEIHFTNGELEGAETEARRAVAANRDNFGAHRLLSRIYALRSGLRERNLNRAVIEQAIAELREVVRLLSSDAEGWALLGDFYAATDREREAIEAFTRWTAAQPTLETQFYAYLTLGRELSPDAANARLGGALLRAGRGRDAVAAFRRAIALDPENLGYVELLGEALESVGDDRAAIIVYEELLAARGVGNEAIAGEENRRIAESLLQGALEAQKRAGRGAEARATVERMRRVLGAQNPAADLALIELLRDEGRRQDALAAAQAARRNFPDEPQFVWLEASLLADLNRVDEGVTLLRGRLTGDARGDYTAYMWLASVYLQAGRGRESIEAAQRALEIAARLRIQSATNEALIMLASGQERAGDARGAEESLRRVLTTDANNATALNNLGYFLVERNERLDEALELIQRAVRLRPNTSSFLDSLGWAYFKLGRLDEAERHLTDAARRDPTSTAIQEHLGDLYFRQGKTEQARAAWQRALSLSVETTETARLRAKLNGEQAQ